MEFFTLVFFVFLVFLLGVFIGTLVLLLRKRQDVDYLSIWIPLFFVLLLWNGSGILGLHKYFLGFGGPGAGEDIIRPPLWMLLHLPTMSIFLGTLCVPPPMDVWGVTPLRGLMLKTALFGIIAVVFSLAVGIMLSGK